jgi:FkbM family methyltransferase
MMKNVLRKVFKGIARIIPKFFFIKIYQVIGNNINLVVSKYNIIWDAKEASPMIRGLTLMKNEPGTIEWINTYIKESDIVYDIGANVGIYSLYIAKKTQARVYSFEPESLNYSILNKNIYHNGLQDRITAYNFAVNDKEELSILNLSNFIAGGSCHNFHEELNPNHEEFNPVFKQGAIGLSLDYLVENLFLEQPNHIKIDVDGNEYKVIAVMDAVLKNKTLKTIWIELNSSLKKDDELINKIIQYGFKEEKNLTDIIDTIAWNTTFINRLFVRI